MNDRPILSGQLHVRTASAARRFLSVSEIARMFGMSAMTVYRAINAGEFPAVRVRGRLFVPASAVDEMVSAAIADQTVVDAADWVSKGVTR